MRLGLKVDVDTRRGMDEGVPRLLEALAAAGVRASFLVTMGPDRSGRAILRAFRRGGFAGKMVRTNALRMYGLRTALSGTLLPGRPVGSGRPDLLRGILAAGHECGIHGWDHVRWQDRIRSLPPEAAAGEMSRAAAAFADAVGRPPECAAAPGWAAPPPVFAEEERLGLRWASDTRGSAPFLPGTGGRTYRVPQVPTTLPTLDEMLGRDGVDGRNFPERIAAAALAAGRDGVLTVHAEAEGGAWLPGFRELLARLADAGVAAVPCGTLLEGVDPASLPVHGVVDRPVPGRAGLLAFQGDRAAASPTGSWGPGTPDA